MYLSIVIVTIFVLILENCNCMRMLKAIPGVPNVTYYDQNYVHSIVLNTRRYGRNSDYKVNLEFVTTAPFGTNVSVTVFFYEYLHNEYRPSFVEWHGNLCTLICGKLFGPMLKRVGLGVCPLPAAKYRLYNLSYDEEFPNIFPFTKGKIEVIYRFEPLKKLILKYDLVLTFKQRIVKSINK